MQLNVSAADLAKTLKLSKRWVNQLVKSLVLKREADGKFYLPEAAEAYYAFKYKSDEELNYDREHTLLEKAKRETAEIELEQLKGKLLYATDVEQVMATMILRAKACLLAIPSKCAPRIIGQKNLAVVSNILKNEVYQALSSLQQMPAPREGA